MKNEAKGEVLIDNKRTRVTKWFFQKGSATGWHRHEYDYVVIPMLNGKLKLISESGEEKISELEEGAPYFRKAGTKHNVVNVNNFDYIFFEIEIR